MTADGARVLNAEYFDGRSAQPHAVHLRVQAGELLIERDTGALRVPLVQVHWPERQRHGTRRILLDGGGIVRCQDGPAFDRFARAAGAGESLTVRAQQSWRWTLAAVVALLVAVAAGYRWGLPAAARGVLAFVPASIDERVGEAGYQSIAALLLKPSAIAPERQERLRSEFERAIARTHPRGVGTPVVVRFHAAPRVGPNAFALPGGTIVVTDELLQRLPDRDDVVLGVLAHELGHVRQRHGMRLLVQASLLGAATSMAFGDFSSLLAAAPALIGQLGYSRDFERDADDEAIALLRANGVSPLVMIALFEAISRPAPPAGDAAAASATQPPASTPRAPAGRSRPPELGIAFSSHPADDERIARFRAAAVR